MEELSEYPLDELVDDKRWQLRARKVREESNYDLSPRMAEVYVFDEIGRSTEDIAAVLNITEANVENRRETTRERLGSRYGDL